MVAWACEERVANPTPVGSNVIPTKESHMRRISTSKKTLAALAASAVILGTTGVALAYWTTSGGGSTTSGAVAATGNATGSVVVTMGTAPTGLVPGALAVSVPVSVSNTAIGSVSIGAVTAAVTDAFSARPDLAKPACTASDFTVAGATDPVGVLAGGTTSGALDGITIRLNDGPANQDNCKNVSVPLTFTAAAE